MGKFCVAALDRVLVFSNDGEEHLVHLKQVTKKLRFMGFLVDSDKSGFGFDWAGAEQLLSGNTSLKANSLPLQEEDDQDSPTEPPASGARFAWLLLFVVVFFGLKIMCLHVRR